jgi:2-C-methyl-D-erythritol 4-phosphate cytidylyltransferase/2-C-methyl-D-erythritol 2,4-cyclodiphosphate synthase
MGDVVGVVLAAGASRRFGSAVPKQYRKLGGVSVVQRSVHALTACPEVDRVVVVVAPADLDRSDVSSLGGLPRVSAVVPGGDTRLASSFAGVLAADGADLVLVHDAARPFVSAALVASVLAATRAHGAAVPAVPVGDTVKRADATGFVAATLDRGELRLAQTPQGARRDWLLPALEAAARSGREVTDESQALELAGRKVAVVTGDPGNLKITTQDDWADALERIEGTGLRVGHGYDVHRFGGACALTLGGVVFTGETGLVGHSDADVVLHAAMDAILGAAGLPDIGHFFPPSDPQWKGADSMRLASIVLARVREEGFRVVNLDLTVQAERPKIGDRVDAMRSAIATAFRVERGQVGLKATTLEGLGALGRGEGIACHAVALLSRARGGA